MKNYKYILLVFSFLFMGACQDLDIPPTNILTDEDIYNEAGIKAYMVGLYNHLPMDDFNVSQEGDKGGYYKKQAIETIRVYTSPKKDIGARDIRLSVRQIPSSRICQPTSVNWMEPNHG